MIYRAINGASIAGDGELTAEQRSQLEKLKNFTPMYYSSSDNTIVIQNMLHGHEGASYMDIKLGTSHYTLQEKQKGKDKVASDKKIAKGFAPKYGYTITGYDCQGDIYDRHSFVIKSNRQQHLRKAFVYNGEFKVSAAQRFANVVLDLVIYIKAYNTFEIRGASLFIVMDFKNENYDVKQIDLNSFEEIGKVDEGFLFGLNTLQDDINHLIHTVSANLVS